jgi:hypothetical protein
MYWDRIYYVNMGLVYGQPKVGSRECLSYNDLGTLHRELRETCPEQLWAASSAAFIHQNIKTLEQFPFIPWNMPKWLGGPGLLCQGDQKFSWIDRKAASIIRSGIIKLQDRRQEYAIELDRFVKRELDLDKVTFESARPLLAAEEVDIFTNILNDQDLKQNSMELYASLCIETVLTKPIEKFTTLCLEGLQDRNAEIDYKTNLKYRLLCHFGRLVQDHTIATALACPTKDEQTRRKQVQTQGETNPLYTT